MTTRASCARCTSRTSRHSLAAAGGWGKGGENVLVRGGSCQHKGTVPPCSRCPAPQRRRVVLRGRRALPARRARPAGLARCVGRRAAPLCAGDSGARGRPRSAAPVKGGACQQQQQQRQAYRTPCPSTPPPSLLQAAAKVAAARAELRAAVERDLQRERDEAARRARDEKKRHEEAAVRPYPGEGRGVCVPSAGLFVTGADTLPPPFLGADVAAEPRGAPQG